VVSSSVCCYILQGKAHFTTSQVSLRSLKEFNKAWTLAMTNAVKSKVEAPDSVFVVAQRDIAECKELAED
jgi:hypothetical protein